MGYTHYMRNLNVLEKFKDGFIKDAEVVLKNHKGIIQREYDNAEPPILNSTEVIFNGIGDDGLETFYIDLELEGDFNFCKTARKPYDLVVCEILILLFYHHHESGIKVRSDGFSSEEPLSVETLDENWPLAIKNIQKTFGYNVEVNTCLRLDLA